MGLQLHKTSAVACVGMIVRLRKTSYGRSDSLKYVQWGLVLRDSYRGCMRLKREEGGGATGGDGDFLP